MSRAAVRRSRDEYGRRSYRLGDRFWESAEAEAAPATTRAAGPDYWRRQRRDEHDSPNEANDYRIRRARPGDPSRPGGGPRRRGGLAPMRTARRWRSDVLVSTPDRRRRQRRRELRARRALRPDGSARRSNLSGCDAGGRRDEVIVRQLRQLRLGFYGNATSRNGTTDGWRGSICKGPIPIRCSDSRFDHGLRSRSRRAIGVRDPSLNALGLKMKGGGYSSASVPPSRSTFNARLRG